MEVVLEQLPVPLILRGVEGVIHLQLLHQWGSALRLEPLNSVNIADIASLKRSYEECS